MRVLPKSIEKLINEFSRLPGIGPKTASRLTFYLYKLPESQFLMFSEAVNKLKINIHSCTDCFNMAEGELCELCSDRNRNPRLICVVEDPLDVVAVEQTGSFSGRYHVLGGVLSPIDGIGPTELKIAELVARVKQLQSEGHDDDIEIILATNPSLEGEATNLYIIRQLQSYNPKITKLARGIPVGGDLEYTDEQTLSDALNYRKEISGLNDNVSERRDALSVAES